MEDIIIGSVGSAVGLVALVLFIRGMLFLLGGAETLGEVVSSRQDKKGSPNRLPFAYKPSICFFFASNSLSVISPSSYIFLYFRIISASFSAFLAYTS